MSLILPKSKCPSSKDVEGLSSANRELAEVNDIINTSPTMGIENYIFSSDGEMSTSKAIWTARCVLANQSANRNGERMGY